MSGEGTEEKRDRYADRAAGCSTESYSSGGPRAESHARQQTTGDQIGLFNPHERIGRSFASVYFSFFGFQGKLAAEAQNKYERELMLHAADVEALQAVKKQTQMSTQNLKQQEEKAQKATVELRQGRTDWEQQEKRLKVRIFNFLTVHG